MIDDRSTERRHREYLRDVISPSAAVSILVVVLVVTLAGNRRSLDKDYDIANLLAMYAPQAPNRAELPGGTRSCVRLLHAPLWCYPPFPLPFTQRRIR